MRDAIQSADLPIVLSRTGKRGKAGAIQRRQRFNRQ